MSDAALLAEYGLLQAIGVVSQNGASCGPRLPYTSSVLTWRNRNGRGRAVSSARHASSSVSVPLTLVSTKTPGPMMERSTCDSAARCAIASGRGVVRPASSACTSPRSRMSPRMKW